MVNRLADRSSHREHTWITARHHRNTPSGRRSSQRRLGPEQFFAIVRRVPGLTSDARQPVEIGTVAEQLLGIGEGSRCRWRHPIGGTRTNAHNGQSAGHRHLPRPGTRIIAK